MRLKSLTTIFVIILLLGTGGRSFSQKDSLYFGGLADKFRTLLKSNLDSAKVIAKKITDESIARQYKKGIGLGNNYLGLCKIYEGKYETAISFFKGSLVYYDTTKSSKGVCDVYSNLGICYDYLGRFPEAIRCYLAALKMSEAISDSSAIARTTNNLGTIYFQQKNYVLARNYFERSLKIREMLKDNYGIASCCLNIASCLNSNRSKAGVYIEKCIRYAHLAGDSVLLADAYTSMAENYSEDKEYSRAISLFNQALPIYQSFNDARALSQLYYYIGRNHSFLKEEKNAHNYFLLSYQIAKKIDNLEGVKMSAEGLIATSAYLQKPDSVSFYLGEYESARDSLFSENNTKQIADMQTKYETDKKDREIKLKDLEIEKQTVESRQKSFQRNAFIIGFLLMGCMFFFILKSYRQKKRSFIEISAQKKIIEEKNKDITDSINYAKRIQEVILPPIENTTPVFPESFILFLPKDVVSGDFYWYCLKNTKKLVAAVDCTGHGVPGALMSMLGNAFLNEIVNEKRILQPNEILGELRNRIKHSLKQKGEIGEAKDGMDMALLSFNSDNSRVEFAGANNPVWICRKKEQGYIMNEYHADKRPIGYYMGKSLPFTNHVIDLEKGDTLYIFTDGYADQFGGPKGKKFKSSQLRQVFLGIQDQPMEAQKEILHRTFMEWKGTYEQIDDVCIIGIRV